MIPIKQNPANVKTVRMFQGVSLSEEMILGPLGMIPGPLGREGQ